MGQTLTIGKQFCMASSLTKLWTLSYSTSSEPSSTDLHHLTLPLPPAKHHTLLLPWPLPYSLRTF